MSGAVLFLVAWAAKATLLLLAAGAAASLFRSGTGKRAVWVAGFGAALFLPALSLVPTSTAVQIALSSVGQTKGDVTDWPFLVWIVGVLVSGTCAACGFVAISRLKRNSQVWEGFAGLEEVSHVSRVSRWELRISQARTPVTALTWGVRSPVVLLPHDAMEWESDRIRAVLLHELAHVRQRDSAVQVLSLILSSFLWFSPAVWLSARALRAAMESAADESVISSGVRASSYAEHLVAIAKESAPSRRQRLAGVSLLGQGNLEHRIRRIVSSRGGSTPPLWASRVVPIAAFVLAAGLGIVRLSPAALDPFSGKSAEWLRGYALGKRYSHEVPSRDSKYAIERSLINRPSTP